MVSYCKPCGWPGVFQPPWRGSSPHSRHVSTANGSVNSIVGRAPAPPSLNASPVRPKWWVLTQRLRPDGAEYCRYCRTNACSEWIIDDEMTIVSRFQLTFEPKSCHSSTVSIQKIAPNKAHAPNNVAHTRGAWDWDDAATRPSCDWLEPSTKAALLTWCGVSPVGEHRHVPSQAGRSTRAHGFPPFGHV